MALPERIGGPRPEEKKPGLVVAIGVGKKMPSRIGGPREEEEEPEGESESMDNGGAKDAAVDELLSAIENKSRSQAKSALEAFFYACDSEPHDEGEHTEEEGKE